jgi:hypothetical protein
MRIVETIVLINIILMGMIGMIMLATGIDEND